MNGVVSEVVDNYFCLVISDLIKEASCACDSPSIFGPTDTFINEYLLEIFSLIQYFREFLIAIISQLHVGLFE
jgi:hypothetical protein